MSGGHSTLASGLDQDAVPFEVLRRRHGPLLSVVELLLGFEPNADRYLELWPVGFRTYNLIAPVLIGMPALMFAPRDRKALVGLVMYTSSRAAQCPYCSAHTCSFALRRGAEEGAVARALVEGDAMTGVDAPTKTALRMAGALGQWPGAVSQGLRDEFVQSFSDTEAEHLVLPVAAMGFLNKFMDVIGVPLEDGPTAEAWRVISESGWTPGKHGGRDQRPDERQGHSTPLPAPDSIADKLRLVALMPALVKWERRATAHIPARSAGVQSYLRQHCGFEVPVLARLRGKRAVRALAAALRENTDAGPSVVGLAVKSLAGISYAKAAEDDQLLRAMEVFAAQAATTEAQRAGGTSGLDAAGVTALRLAEAAAPSPSTVTEDIIDAALRDLSAPAIVEVVVWVGVLQAIHRLDLFYGA